MQVRDAEKSECLVVMTGIGVEILFVVRQKESILLPVKTVLTFYVCQMTSLQVLNYERLK